MDIERELKEKLLKELLKVGEETDRQSEEQMSVPKTETTTCEWCEGELSFEVVWHSFGSSFVDRAMFCPNCGRRLEN